MRAATYVAAVMANVDLIRDELLELHRMLIDEERARYERANGTTTAGRFLELLTTDTAFAWLQPFTALIVDLDDPATSFDAWIRRARALLRPDGDAGAFRARYDELVQQSPDLVVAHGAAMRVLRD
jgi:hypothetical protein